MMNTEIERKIKLSRRELERLKGKKQQLQEDCSSLLSTLKGLRRKASHIDESMTIIQIVSKQTQDQLRYRIEEIVDLAMEAVLQDPYNLKLDFTVRGGKTEADIRFGRRNTLVDPMNSSGGGAIDIASFALRLAIWSLQKPQPMNTFFLDEPFKFLSMDLQHKASLLLQELSRKMGIQIIMVSHNEELIESSDRVFSVKLVNGKSRFIEGRKK